MSRPLINIIFFALFFVFLGGCPATCITTPAPTDYLWLDADMSIRGLLFEMDEEGQRESLGNRQMPYEYRYYGRNGAELEASGMRVFWGSTESDGSGFFSVPFSSLDLETPGLYEFTFTYPIAQFQKKLITFLPPPPPERPDFQSPRQLVYVDWETQYPLLRPYVADAYRGSLREETHSIWSDNSLMTFTKWEVQRVLSQYYNNRAMRGIEFIDADGTGVQKIEMSTCHGIFEDGECQHNETALGGVGACYDTDYLNLSLSDFPCYAIVPALIGNNGYNVIFSRYVDSADPLTTRVTDIGIRLARTAAHELGHAFGLVNHNLFGGISSNFHNPSEPSTIAAERYIPRAIMKGREIYSLAEDVGDCSITPRPDREPGEPLERCYHRFNEINWQYLDLLF